LYIPLATSGIWCAFAPELNGSFTFVAFTKSLFKNFFTKLFEPKKAISCREFYQIARYYQKFHHRNRRFLSLKSFL
jgi:hypothetical protein